MDTAATNRLTIWKRCALLALAASLVACGGNGGGNAVGTEPPGPDDEPLSESSEFNNAVGFAVTREPGPRIPVNDVAEFTDSDFEQGLPEPVINVPAGIDTTTNLPPFFEGLQNIEVTAGEQIEIVYLPQDPEGGLPGMFPEKLPQGASFDDNFNGSKTFRWQPLQMDVGVSRFTVTALDPVDPNYRSSHPIFIRVSLPDDPSTIPNVAPMLDEVIPHTARVNDPVVFELKGIDLNGTIPTLEVPNAPAGATLSQHPRFAEVYVLRFIPIEAGEITFDVLARDALDADLTSVTTVSIAVLEPSTFNREGQRLRDLAAARGVDIGFAALQSFYHQPDGALYADIAAQEFSMVTPENSLKMDALNPEPGRYQFAATDNLMAYARANNMQVHGHPLVWYRQLPEWIEDSAIDTRETHMLEYIDRVMTRYSDIELWDVVNEPLDDQGGLRESVWLESMGASYIDKALLRAREQSSTATLLINEFDISMAGPKFDGLLVLIDDLLARSIPLDGIGFQMHLFTSYDRTEELASNFAAIADRGLSIYITELDVSLADGADENRQAEVYQQVVSVCLAQPNCKAIQMWGFTDQYSFRSIFDPLPFDRSYQVKPAYTAIQDALSGSN